MSNKFSFCIACQSDNIQKVRGAFQITIEGKKMKIPDLEYYVCSQCGEQFMDLDNESKIDVYLKRKRAHVT
jgi:YgiT-type zinc finger domain-containing protein